MTAKPTARALILDRLANTQRPLAVHELEVIGHSQISLARRLYEMQRDGLVTSANRPGTAYKEWSMREVFSLEG